VAFVYTQTVPLPSTTDTLLLSFMQAPTTNYRSSDVAGPRLWNKLPASLRSSDSLCQFRRQL